MADSRYRRQRGSETQTIVAAWFAENGWPYAEPVGAGRRGKDVTGMPGLMPEVKARRDLNLPTWLRQHADELACSVDHGGEPCPGYDRPVPFVVHRPDGYGPARIAEWPVTMRLDDFTRLLHEAGYGTKED